MEAFKKMNSFQNCRVRFKTYEGEFEGTVKSLSTEMMTVLFQHSVLLPKRTFMGNLRFNCCEIESFSLIARYDNNEEKIVYGSKNCYEEKFDVADFYEDNDERDVSAYVQDDSEDEYVLNLPKNLSDKLPCNTAIIDLVDDEFYTAVQCISKENLIGLSFEGPSVGRNGILSWMCVSIPSCTYLFDIAALQKEAFDKGLRNICEAKDVEKVVHDCRQPADCLFHQFETNLVNIFDTQVADFFIQMQRRKDDEVIPYVSSLNTSVFQHLQVPSEYLYQPKQHANYSEKVISFNLRPIGKEFQNVFIKNVIYLRLLKEKLFDLLMEPFHESVNSYINVVSNASTEELSLGISTSDMLPPALLMKGIKTVCFKKFVDIQHPVSSGVCNPNLANPLKNFILSLEETEKATECEAQSRIGETEEVADCGAQNRIKKADFKLIKNPIHQSDFGHKSLMHNDQTYFSLCNAEHIHNNKESSLLLSDKHLSINSKEKIPKNSVDVWEKLCCPLNTDYSIEQEKFKLKICPG